MAWQRQANVPGGSADEAALLAGLRAGRREAFEALHGGYAAPIYNLALRIVDDPHDAQDVAQEVLIKVFRNLPQDEADLNLTAWLYRVTVNAAFDHVRARGRRPAVALEAVPEPAAPVDEFERAELAGRVDSTLRSLPKRQQVALLLRDVHGMSVGETASVLGVTRGSADVLLSRARRGFRRLFLAHDAEAPGASSRCRLADETLAGGVGGGISAARRAGLLEHARTCPDCRRTVELWGAAPVGLGLFIHQVALPAKLSLAATFAAASAAGVAIPAAGLGAAGAVSAAGSAAAAGGSAGAAGSTAGAAGAGLLAKVGAAVGVKAVAVAAAATVVVGTAGYAGVEVRRANAETTGPVATQSAAPGGAGETTAGETGAGSTTAGPRTEAGRSRQGRAAAREGRRDRRRAQDGGGERPGAGNARAKSGDGGPTRAAAGPGAGNGSARSTDPGARTSGNGAGGSAASTGGARDAGTGGGSGSAEGSGAGTGSGGTGSGGTGSGGTAAGGGSGQ